MSAHAVALPPSSMQRRMACPGSLALEEKLPDTSSEFADEGTAAHTLAAWTLESEAKYTRAFMGRVIEVVNGEGKLRTCRQFEVDEDMCDNVQIYVDAIMATVEAYKLAGAVNVELQVEQRVDFSPFSGIATYRGKPDSFGTSDVIILVEWADGTCLLDVEDLKYGMGVQVYAEKNEQLRTYALGALARYDLTYNVTRIRYVIHQPRLDHVDEEECSIEELLAFAGEMRAAAARAVEFTAFTGGMENPPEMILTPGEKQCKFCKAKGTCPALRKMALETVSGGSAPATVEEFDNLEETVKANRPGLSDDETLDALFPNLNLVYDWASGVMAAIEARLHAGVVFKNAKLVRGKKGNRAWTDKAAAEAKLKAMRLKQEEMYDLKLISPTTAEKLLKKENPRRWSSLQDFIGQSEGKIGVAPMSDERDAINAAPLANDFTDIDLTDLV